MLDSALRSGLFLTLLAVALAPVASASILGEDSYQSLEDQASQVHPWAGWAIDQVPHRGGSGDSGDSSSGAGSGSGSGSGSSNPANEGAAAARPVVRLALHKASTVTDQLPQDPLSLALQQVEPVRATAEGLPVMVLGAPESAPATGAAPASASVAQVEPDASVPLLVGATAAAAAAVTLLWLAGSSGSLGAAGAAGTGGKLAATDLRRLLPFASPLFTRFEKDTVLGHPKREALYALILQDPGVSLQSLCDSTGLSRTAVTHHLRLMELQHLIVSKRMGRSRHYYENGGRFGRDQKDAYAVLQNDRSKEVAQFVKQNPGAIQKAICAAVGV
ncbi:MAG TPA: winged helix-turn-helix transcriptional regulator, partial [Candidatus Thermoplasmatota archaeon]|nr:winged helix-turn-helix transcriptional regulator [Candidatus Thermoplasmatota archaeon]